MRGRRAVALGRLRATTWALGGDGPWRCGAARGLTTTTARGPLAEYDERVAAGRLRNDQHQRGIIQNLQHLHDELRAYHAPPIHVPSAESLRPARAFGFLSVFGGRGGGGAGSRQAKKGRVAIPEDLPRGLYLYGDVGSGKTMLMDLFYETLPGTVRTRTRIHFHNFMQEVHRRLHQLKVQHGDEVDAVPVVAAEIAQKGNVLCFDEFQCTDVATAMILRRLLEGLMAHGVVLVTTSNRHPDELYKNGLQRESFVPAITLLKNRLHVINLDSPTDYRKMARPGSGVYHTRLDQHAEEHAARWFRFLGDPGAPEPHAEVQQVWGREILVPRVSGRCAWFTFAELMGQPKSAADYLALVREYEAFVVTGVPGMTLRERDVARRFITFVDAVYEGNAKLVLTTEKPLGELFVSRDEVAEGLAAANARLGDGAGLGNGAKLDDDHGHGHGHGHGRAIEEGDDVDVVEDVMEDVPGSMGRLQAAGLFAGEEEAFAFARALSRLAQMESREWVERGLGLESRGGQGDKESWTRTRSKQMEDSY